MMNRLLSSNQPHRGPANANTSPSIRFGFSIFSVFCVVFVLSSKIHGMRSSNQRILSHVVVVQARTRGAAHVTATHSHQHWHWFSPIKSPNLKKKQYENFLFSVVSNPNWNSSCVNKFSFWLAWRVVRVMRRQTFSSFPPCGIHDSVIHTIARVGRTGFVFWRIYLEMCDAGMCATVSKCIVRMRCSLFTSAVTIGYDIIDWLLPKAIATHPNGIGAIWIGQRVKSSSSPYRHIACDSLSNANFSERIILYVRILRPSECQKPFQAPGNKYILFFRSERCIVVSILFCIWMAFHAILLQIERPQINFLLPFSFNFLWLFARLRRIHKYKNNLFAMASRRKKSSGRCRIWQANKKKINNRKYLWYRVLVERRAPSTCETCL